MSRRVTPSDTTPIDTTSNDQTVGERSGMAIALDLLDFAIAMRAERFRREHPEADESTVEAAARSWLLDRPGAPYGDAIGRPVSWPSRTPL